MHLLPIFEWLQNTAIGTSIRESIYFFPIIETLHVIGLSASVGLILLTDLRLIGVLMPDQPVSKITKQVKPWMLAGFAIMFSTGGLMFWAEAAKCYESTTFRVKLTFLLLAGLNAVWFESTLGRSLADWENQTVLPDRARFAGWASLACWAGVVIFGRWTAYGLQ